MCQALCEMNAAKRRRTDCLPCPPASFDVSRLGDVYKLQWMEHSVWHIENPRQRWHTMNKAPYFEGCLQRFPEEVTFES